MNTAKRILISTFDKMDPASFILIVSSILYFRTILRYIDTMNVKLDERESDQDIIQTCACDMHRFLMAVLKRDYFQMQKT